MKPNLYILIAVYNESDNVDPLIRDLKNLIASVTVEFDAHILFVDDGSRDNTAQLLKQYENSIPLTVLQNSKNMGPGAAFRTGFEFLASRMTPADWLVTMEGDNTSNLKTLSQMLVRRKEGYDVVLASVYSYGGGFIEVPWWRMAVSHAANQLTMSILRLYGLHVLSSFFRLHSGSTILRLQKVFGPGIIEQQGFEWALEMLYKMAMLQLKMSEVETSVDWGKRKGTSKMRTLRTLTGYFRVLLSHRKWRHQIVECHADS